MSPDKEQATRLADALDRMDALLRPAGGFITVPYTSATVQAAVADMALIREALLRRLPDGEPYCYIYEWDTAGGVHQDTTHYRWNGALPNRTIPVYTAPPAERIAALEAALRNARASLHGHGYNAGVIAVVDAALRAIEEVKHD